MAGLILRGHKNWEHPHSRPHFGIVNSSTYLEMTHGFSYNVIKFEMVWEVKNSLFIVYLFIYLFFELSVVRGVGRLI